MQVLGRWNRPLAYLMLLAATLAGYFAIDRLGARLQSGTEVQESRAAELVSAPPLLLRLLLALVVVVVCARGLGAAVARLGQPPVIGEVLAGIALGPSLLGVLAPGLMAAVLPEDVAPGLTVIAQVGVILFMFLVGLELDTDIVKRKSRAAIAISHASIVLPFLLGAALALAIYPELAGENVPFRSFALFMGISMAITAFPVLARILSEQGLQRSPMGSVALTCAAIDDVTAWCLLAVVTAVVQSGAVTAASTQLESVAFTVGLTLAYILGVWLLLRPLARRLIAWREATGHLTQGMLAVVCVALLGSAALTELIGIHALFGAFLLGAIVPHDSALAKDLENKLADLVVVLFLPVYFAFTGMRTQIGLIDGARQWLVCGSIIVVASLGKFGGSYCAARLQGFDRRQAASLGVLMNTRGLMELVVLNIGLDLGVISLTLYAMMVVMALLTTLLTTPILRQLQKPDSVST